MNPDSLHTWFPAEANANPLRKLPLIQAPMPTN